MYVGGILPYYDNITFSLSVKIGDIQPQLPSQYAHVLSCFSCVWLLVTPWTIACQAPLSMGFSRQEYWSGLPFPSLLVSIRTCFLEKGCTKSQQGREATWVLVRSVVFSANQQRLWIFSSRGQGCLLKERWFALWEGCTRSKFHVSLASRGSWYMNKAKRSHQERPGASPVVRWSRTCLQCRRHGFHPWAWKIPWRREIATHSSIFAGKILMDRGACWATIYRVSKGWTWLSNWTHARETYFILEVISSAIRVLFLGAL